ncbi:cytochrome P450 4C1 [Nilaparvata lugens]|uniref:Cytochrome P450 CYP4DD1 n=1 Tax=Nilaparvata lugens TaxID=108931 RepID=A0A0K0LBC5_NILLU|nr:cytochrome P450 4C1 [Nilaparvata lugens]XP_022183859.1 cytochrome P450 4C1 [Nilaparvata lugens]XP_022183860.1 cytochrome P450 4C1 [Nilaparvata lugens]XP_022183861.1 cytochrome P450 4C1 [Nilaparvata lugens]AIW80007.1 cytochrome P450 CYP4DD1 [Nilaparvata lugens]
MLLLFTLIFIIVFALHYLWQKKTKRIHELTKDYPKPTHWPIVGCTFEFGTNPKEFFGNLCRMCDEQGSVFAAWLGPELFIVLSNVEETELLLSNNKLLKKAFGYDFLHPWLGKSLLTDEDESWRTKRKIITPAFHFQILEQFMDVINKNSLILIRELKKEIGKPSFDISRYITLCTLDIISESSMGTEINAQLNNSPEFVTSLRNLSEAVLYRFYKPWLYPDFVYNMTSAKRAFNKDLKVVHDVIMKVIQSKKLKRSQAKSNGVNGSSAIKNGKSNGVHSTTNGNGEINNLAFGQKKKSAFLDLLLDYTEHDGSYSEQSLIDEVNTFMFAGHDTTTSAINFALHAIMKHPEVQEKAMKEIEEIFGDSNAMPEFNDLPKMKYIECIIKETLRLWPSVPYVARTVTEDTTLKCGYKLPAGCSAVLMFYKLHRDPQLYSEPDRFNPERFLDDSINGRKPYSYCPFSAGPRNCIGQKFAMMEMKIVISTVLRHYRLITPPDGPDINVVAELILRSVSGIHVKIENRS